MVAAVVAVALLLTAFLMLEAVELNQHQPQAAYIHPESATQAPAGFKTIMDIRSAEKEETHFEEEVRDWVVGLTATEGMVLLAVVVAVEVEVLTEAAEPMLP